MKDLVLASESIPEKCVASLHSLGFEVIAMPRYDRLGDGVCSHPDMLVFFYGDKYICTSDFFARSKDVFDKINALGYSPVLTDEIPDKDYPNDILFNAFTANGKLFCLERAVSKKVCKLAFINNVEIVNVRQGYAKCSVCKVSDNAIITADTGIAAAAERHGIDVLKICEGYVRLDGFDTGFIGGASGSFGDTVYFCGDIFSHPDGKLIEQFCNKHKKHCVSLSDEPLFDVGTLFFLSKV